MDLLSIRRRWRRAARNARFYGFGLQRYRIHIDVNSITVTMALNRGSTRWIHGQLIVGWMPLDDRLISMGNGNGNFSVSDAGATSLRSWNPAGASPPSLQHSI